MIVHSAPQAGAPVRGTHGDIEACLAGKAYIAVLKHRLTNGASDKTFKEIYEEAYRVASRSTRDILTMGTGSQFDETPETLGEIIEPMLAGKAYIAVLKHRLAHGATDKTSREIFEEAYRTAANMARRKPPATPAAGKQD